jgi:multiple sugar transport system ATP-binding protein
MMDEPIGALDAEFRERMAEELRALHDRMGATTVYVTHDQLEAMQMGDKIVVMNHGVVEQFGTPQEIYDHPATLFVADFIGSPAMNFLRFEGAVRPGDAAVTLDGVEVATPRIDEARPGDAGPGRAARAHRPERQRRYRGRIEAPSIWGRPRS